MKSYVFQDAVESSTRLFGRKEVRVVFSGDEARTDGNTVFLPSMPEAAEINGDQAEVIRGYRDHESAHVRQTDVSKATMDRLEQMSNAHPVLGSLAQYCEDVRAEKGYMEEYPGSRTSLTAVNVEAAKVVREQISAIGPLDQVIPKIGTDLQFKLAFSSLARNDIGVHSNGVYDEICEEIKKVNPELFKFAQRVAKAASELPTGRKGSTIDEKTAKAGTAKSLDLAQQIFDEYKTKFIEAPPPPPPQPQPNEEQDDQPPHNPPPEPGDGGDGDEEEDHGSGKGKGKGGGKNGGKGKGGGGDDEGDEDPTKPDEPKSEDEEPKDEGDEADDEGDDDEGDEGDGDGAEAEGDSNGDSPGGNKGRGDGQPGDGDGGGHGDVGGAGEAAEHNDSTNSGSGGGGAGSQNYSLPDGSINASKIDIDGSLKKALSAVVSNISKGNGSTLRRTYYKRFSRDFSVKAPILEVMIAMNSGGCSGLAGYVHSRSAIPSSASRELNRALANGSNSDQMRNSFIENGAIYAADIDKSISSKKAMIRRALEVELQARDDRRWQSGKSSGKLNMVRLVEATQGMQNVFKSREGGKDMNTVVMMSVDGSGSMHGARRLPAMQLSYAMSEALERTGCDMEVLAWGNVAVPSEIFPASPYSMKDLIDKSQEFESFSMSGGGGFTSMGLVTRAVIKGLRQRMSDPLVRAGFGMFASHGLNSSTPTYDVMMADISELATYRHAKKIYIHMTDGQPDTYPNAREIRQEILAMAAQAEIHVIGVGLDGMKVSHMFPDYVNVTGPDCYDIVMKKVAKILAKEFGNGPSRKAA